MSYELSIYKMVMKRLGIHLEYGKVGLNLCFRLNIGLGIMDFGYEVFIIGMMLWILPYRVVMKRFVYSFAVEFDRKY